MRELMWLKRVLGKFPSGGKHQKLTHLFRELLSEVYLIKISVRLLPHSDWNILNFRIRVLPCINKWFSVGIYLARTQLTNWPYPYRTYFPQVIMSFYFTSMSLKLATIVGNANVHAYYGHFPFSTRISICPSIWWVIWVWIPMAPWWNGLLGIHKSREYTRKDDE